MRVLCAPDSFKGSMTAAVAADAMALGVRDADPAAEVDLCPVSDGGEGFRATLAAALGGTTTFHSVAGPVGKLVTAGLTQVSIPARPGEACQPTVVIEMAEAAGLELIPEEQRDPERTTTHGVGELIRIALDGGARRILLGLGGSATVDGGTGLAQELGYRFFARGGQQIRGSLTGGRFHCVIEIDTRDVDDRIRECDVRVACDVTAPLLGPRGAAQMFSPQKGATPNQVLQLEYALIRLAELCRRDLDSDPRDLPGAGAAGGLGFGAVAFLGARLEPGLATVLEATRFDERLERADLCLTGEGRIDGQTLAGKAVLGVAHAARARGVPVVALVGRIGDDADLAREAGLDDILEIGRGLPRSEAMARGPELLRIATRRAVEEI